MAGVTAASQLSVTATVGPGASDRIVTNTCGTSIRTASVPITVERHMYFTPLHRGLGRLSRGHLDRRSERPGDQEQPRVRGRPPFPREVGGARWHRGGGAVGFDRLVPRRASCRQFAAVLGRRHPDSGNGRIHRLGNDFRARGCICTLSRRTAHCGIRRCCSRSRWSCPRMPSQPCSRSCPPNHAIPCKARCPVRVPLSHSPIGPLDCSHSVPTANSGPRSTPHSGRRSTPSPKWVTDRSTSFR